MVSGSTETFAPFGHRAPRRGPDAIPVERRVDAVAGTRGTSAPAVAAELGWRVALSHGGPQHGHRRFGARGATALAGSARGACLSFCRSHPVASVGLYRRAWANFTSDEKHPWSYSLATPAL